MKKIFSLLISLLISASLMANGKGIFNSKGCTACHQVEADGVGPSLKNISQAYKGQQKELIQFLKGEGKPKLEKGKFAGQYETIMKLQISQTKTLSEKDLKELTNFILSH